MSKAAAPERYQGFRVVSAAEMAAIDRRSIQEFGVPALFLMENAGRAVAQETVRFIKEELGRDPARGMVTVCCGRGNNGGDGLVAARCLKEMGAQVVTYIVPSRHDARPAAKGEPARPSRQTRSGYSPEVLENLRRATAAGVLVQELGEETVDLDVRLRSSDVLIDALLGTGSSGKPAGAIRSMIQRMMKAGKPILAVDIPSGLHPDTGYHSGVFISATLTLTLGLPKRGLLMPHAQRNVGGLKVLDIGLPKALLS